MAKNINLQIGGGRDSMNFRQKFVESTNYSVWVFSVYRYIRNYKGGGDMVVKFLHST